MRASQLVIPLLLLANLSGSCAAGDSGSSAGYILHVPFELETIVPVTRETISREAWYRLDLSPPTTSSKTVLGILLPQDRDGTEELSSCEDFDASRVREWIATGDGEGLYVDSMGIVSGPRTCYHIDESSRRRLDFLIRCNGQKLKGVDAKRPTDPECD